MPLKSDHYIPYMDMFWNVEECQLTNAKVSDYNKYLTNINPILIYTLNEQS